MRLKELELNGFKSFAKKTVFLFDAPITAIVGPNGSGKSNAAEAFRWVLGERSMKSLRGRRGEDLIFNGGESAARANEARATLVFDNRDQLLPIDYNEVAITRRIGRDGANEYAINGSAVRYRDIVELLAGASLGVSDHFIINQGEADRILSATEGERRSMIEDALGLRIYQWKIEDGERKLEQAGENMERVESLRRELAPHIRFLKKQMERIEEAGRLKDELDQIYYRYLAAEAVYLNEERRVLATAKAPSANEVERLEQAVKNHRLGPTADQILSREKKTLAAAETELQNLYRRRDELSRKLGRLEAMLEVKAEAIKTKPDVDTVPWVEVESFGAELETALERGLNLADPLGLKSVLSKIRALALNFLGKYRRAETNPDANGLDATAELRAEKEKWQAELADLNLKEAASRAASAELNDRMARELAAINAGEREFFELQAKLNVLKIELAGFAAREEKLILAETRFKEETVEARVLLGRDPLTGFSVTATDAPPAPSREQQEEIRRRLERLKIKLEDLGLDSGETVKEYQEITSRDAFLAGELNDLEQSAAQLKKVIERLRQKIEREFADGLQKINERFQEFFSLLFSGGTASLALVHLAETAAEGDSEVEILTAPKAAPSIGIDIRVNLPRKKIRGLAMLSGGERALVSIALLFAMSQVNPPPFLVLDETDAALDEANSRKYGAMVENLAKHSQLILITHNRETMSHAGVIYGITLGRDSVSKLLSIKFDEALSYAK